MIDYVGYPEELAWCDSVARSAVRKHEGAIVLTLCGPSGVGKTTIARALADRYQTYIETTEGNPHLARLLQGRRDFDAAANQKWFLDRMAAYVLTANPMLPLVLDQDPSAILLVYGRSFYDAGLMTETHYRQLFDALWSVEERLQQWQCPRNVMCLDAAAETLHQRATQRSPELGGPPIGWFAEVRRRFVGLFSRFPQATRISTSDSSPEQLIGRVETVLASGSFARR